MPECSSLLLTGQRSVSVLRRIWVPPCGRCWFAAAAHYKYAPTRASLTLLLNGTNVRDAGMQQLATTVQATFISLTLDLTGNALSDAY